MIVRKISYQLLQTFRRSTSSTLPLSDCGQKKRNEETKHKKQTQMREMVRYETGTRIQDPRKRNKSEKKIKQTKKNNLFYPSEQPFASHNCLPISTAAEEVALRLLPPPFFSVFSGTNISTNDGFLVSASVFLFFAMG